MAAPTAPASSQAAPAPRLWKAGPSRVIVRTPPLPATDVATARTSSTVGALQPLNVAVSGSAPRSMDIAARLSSSAPATNASIAWAAAGKSGPASSRTGASSRYTPSSQRSSCPGAIPPAPIRSTSALTPSTSAPSTAALPSGAVPVECEAGNCSATFQPASTSRWRSAPRTNGQSPGSAGSPHSSSAV